VFAKDFACVNAVHSAYSRPISADTVHLRNSPKRETGDSIDSQLVFDAGLR
jgi:hypothetical protein